MQKACGDSALQQNSHSLQAYGFRFCFTPLAGVLFTFPSRYWFTVGHRLVFSLGGWSPLIQTEFHVFRPTRDSRGPALVFAYRTFTFCGAAFQMLPLTLAVPESGPTTPRRPKTPGFGLVRVRSPLLAESRLISTPPVNEMVHFAGCRSAHLCIQCAVSCRCRKGFPIRIFPDHSVRAASRDVSPLAASFVACRCLGIHRTP